MKNLALVLVSLFLSNLALADDSRKYIMCKGLKNNHGVFIEKNQFGIEAPFYKKLTYSGMVLNSIELRKSWVKPNTFVSAEMAESLKFEIFSTPTPSKTKALRFDAKKVRILHNKQSVDKVENCEIDSRITWNEQRL